MRATWKTLALAATSCLLMGHRLGLAQVAPATILEIDLENRVNYAIDAFDVSKYATDPNLTTALAARNFRQAQQISDIVAVNGRPAKGTLVLSFRNISLTTAPTPGQAIADSTAANVMDQTFQIMNSDGTVIGSIITFGLGNGTTSPGAPSTALLGDSAIIGGTGAFLGVRGQSSAGRTLVAIRNASVTEDPANRRKIGGGAARFVLTLIPMSRPAVVVTSAGPAVVHAGDFSQVTTAKPAAQGEILSLFASGLGPTRPGVDPGQPFPASPLQAVNSPVEVTVNGRAAEVLSAVGYPGAVDGYQVNFRVPPDTGRGSATIQLSAAWIAGTEVKIAVQ